MPTYQTTPMGKWKFPDQIYRQNQKGYGYAGVGTSHSRPTPDMTGEANPWAESERKTARDRLYNNKQKMLGMIGVKDTTERSQRYENGASQSQSHINGTFPGDKYQSPAGGLRGGTQKFFYFKEGQDWLDSWKKRRIGELNAISKDDFSAGPPQRIPVAPAYNDLDAILAKVLDQFEAGAFSSSLLDDMNKLQGAFLKMGNSITAGKLAQYMRVVGDIQRSVQRITADPERVVQQLDEGDDAAEVADQARRGQPATTYKGNFFKLDTKDIKIIRATGLIATRLVRLLEEINKFVNDDPATRERAMEEIGSRVLGAISEEQSTFGQRSRQPGMRRGPQTIGAISERETRIPEQRPPAELEAPVAGTPAVKPF